MRADKALFSAIDRADLSAVQAALEAGADIDARRKFNTPLLDAVFARNHAISRLLVQHGAVIEGVVHGRDPLTEAMCIGDLALVATLLQVPATPEAVATHFKNNPTKGLLASSWMMQVALRPAWQPVLVALGELGVLASKKERWWRAACHSYSTTVGEMVVLQKYAPLTQGDRPLVGYLAREGNNIAVFDAFKNAGLLDFHAMFEMSTTHGQGALELAMTQRKPIKALTWLIKHAANLPGGREAIGRRIDQYLLLAMGQHASLPMVRSLAKIAGVEPFSIAARAVSGQHRSTLHLLMDSHSEYRRRLEIAAELLRHGANAMALDLTGEPACYRALFKGAFTRQAIELFDKHGAQWQEPGPVWQHLEKDTQRHRRWILEAMETLRHFNVEKQYALLQAHTQSVTGGCARRI